MEAAPVEDSLEDEKVRRAGRELDVGSTDDRAAVQMRRDLRVVRFGHPGDLLRLEQPSDAAEVRLQDRSRAAGENPGELVLRRQALARGHGYRRRARDCRHLLGAVRRHGLLEPQRVEALEPLREPDRSGGSELAVRADQQVAAIPDGLTYPRDVGLRPSEGLQARLARVEGGVRSHRIELDRREPLVDVGGRSLCGEVRIHVDVGRVAWLGIEIGVRAQPLVDPSAEELVRGFADRFAHDVPAGHLDAAEDADERDVGSSRVAAHLHGSEERLDPERVAACDVSIEDILDRPHDDAGMHGRRVDLAHALDPVRSGQRQEDEVAPAVRGRRVADDERAKLGDLHAVSAPVVTDGPTRPKATNAPAPRASCRAPATSPRPQRTTFGNRDPYAEHSLTSSARTCDNQPIRAELDSMSRTELGAPLALREGVDGPPVEIAAYAGTSE